LLIAGLWSLWTLTQWFLTPVFVILCSNSTKIKIPTEPLVGQVEGHLQQSPHVHVSGQIGELNGSQTWWWWWWLMMMMLIISVVVVTGTEHAFHACGWVAE